MSFDLSLVLLNVAENFVEEASEWLLHWKIKNESKTIDQTYLKIKKNEVNSIDQTKLTTV